MDVSSYGLRQGGGAVAKAAPSKRPLQIGGKGKLASASLQRASSFPKSDLEDGRCPVVVLSPIRITIIDRTILLPKIG